MGFTKSVTLLSLLAASSIGFAAPPERDFDRIKQVAPPSLFDCLGACSGGDCLSECVANQSEVEERGGLRRASDAPSSSEAIVDCLLDGLGNVGDCADAFLGTDPSPDRFWVCVDVAARVFLKCSGAALESNGTQEVLGRGVVSVREQKERLFGAEVLSSAAETVYQAFLDPELAPVVIQLRSQPTDGGIAQAEPVAEKTFAECIGEFTENSNSCKTYAEGSDRLKVCNKVAERVFNKCAGVPLK